MDEASGSQSHQFVRGQGVPCRSPAQKKKGRAFHKLYSGIRIGQLMGDSVAHVVLTSAPGTSYEALNHDWQVFYKRLSRTFGRVPYCKVKTGEGYGVFHVLVRTNRRIPQAWISANWSDIRKGSIIVWINEIYGDSRQAAGYLATQYLSGQDKAERLSASLDWIKKGSTREWRGILSKAHYSLVEAIAAWEAVLHSVSRAALMARIEAVQVQARKELPPIPVAVRKTRRRSRKSGKASS